MKKKKKTRLKKIEKWALPSMKVNRWKSKIAGNIKLFFSMNPLAIAYDSHKTAKKTKQKKHNFFLS